MLVFSKIEVLKKKTNSVNTPRGVVFAIQPLLRARKELSPRSLSPILQRQRRQRFLWTSDLKKPLEDIFKVFRVSFEVIDVPDVDHIHLCSGIDQYVQDVHARDRARSSAFTVFDWVGLDDIHSLEKDLKLNLTQLVTSLNKVGRRRDAGQRIVLIQFGVPKRIAKFIDYKKQRDISNRFPELGLRTRMSASSRMFLREAPSTSSTIIGKQVGDMARLDLLEEASNGDVAWRKVRTRESMVIEVDGKRKAIEASQEAWISKAGLQFSDADLKSFEAMMKVHQPAVSRTSIKKNITRMRKLSHEKATDFDTILGTSNSGTYLSDIPQKDEIWQLFHDVDAFRGLDLRPVDAHHILVGLDALQRAEKPKRYLGFSVGTNWAASTWAGDLGSGVADMHVSKDIHWERSGRRSEKERFMHYMSTRAGLWDLLGDVDSWSLTNFLASGGKRSMLEGLMDWYQAGQDGCTGIILTHRKQALEKFLDHYGFDYSFSDFRLENQQLTKQAKPTKRIVNEIYLFSRIWYLKRVQDGSASWNWKISFPSKRLVQLAVGFFLDWIESEAYRHKVDIASKRA